MIALDYTILYQIVLVLLLWAVLRTLLFQPYLKLFEERERKTSGVRQETADLEREGARLRAEYEEKIAQAEAAAHAAKDAIIQAARRQSERILSEVRDETGRFLESVRAEVYRDLARERPAAAAEAAAVARVMVSKILGRNVA